MQHQVLPPRVKYRQAPQLQSELCSPYIEESSPCRTEQRRVEHLRAVQRNRIQDIRHGEHDVEIRHWQELALSRIEPLLPSTGLTAWAISVAAGAVHRV